MDGEISFMAECVICGCHPWMEKCLPWMSSIDGEISSMDVKYHSWMKKCHPWMTPTDEDDR